MIDDSTPYTHGQRVAYLSRIVRRTHETLSRRALRDLETKLKAEDMVAAGEGVNFSRVQIEQILRPFARGIPVEVETWGPYLANFDTATGAVHEAQLSAEDLTGIQLARLFCELLPGARLVSLCDDYNYPPADQDGFSDRARRNFKLQVVQVLKRRGVLASYAQSGRDYLMLSENDHIAYAQRLVDFLEQKPGLIQRNGQEIMLHNENAENPLYRTVRLRSKAGRWCCEALDAAAFLKPGNDSIVHLVVLPDYMQTQQDRLWEILRIVGMQPANYHNIFYDPSLAPEHIAQIIRCEFQKCLRGW